MQLTMWDSFQTNRDEQTTTYYYINNCRVNLHPTLIIYLIYISEDIIKIYSMASLTILDMAKLE